MIKIWIIFCISWLDDAFLNFIYTITGIKIFYLYIEFCMLALDYELNVIIYKLNKIFELFLQLIYVCFVNIFFVEY